MSIGNNTLVAQSVSCNVYLRPEKKRKAKLK